MKAILGIELDNYLIKLIFVENTSGKLLIKKYLCKEIPTGTVQNGTIVEIDYILKQISSFLKNEKIKAKRICVLLKSSSIIIRSETSRLITEKEINNYIKLNINKMFPIDISKDYVTDYKIDEITYHADKKTIITYVAVPSKLVNQYSILFKELKIPPLKIDIYESSISKLFSPISRKESSVIITVDICSYCAQVVILFCEFVIYRQQINFNSELIHVFFNSSPLELNDKTKEILKTVFTDKLKLYLDNYKLRYDFGDNIILYLLGRKIQIIDFESYIAKQIGASSNNTNGYTHLILNNDANCPIEESQGIIGLVM